jgi:branched-chain amino acid aminotransferase
MVQLQVPKYVYARGRVRPWEEAVFHISSEAVVRGLNVFEGLKAYWQPDGGSFGIVAIERHWRRLRRSAKLLHIPFEMSLASYEEACHSLVQRLCDPDRDMWLRTTLYVVEGHWGEGTVADLVITGYQQPKKLSDDIDIGVSTWQRAPDGAMPCRIKTSSNYQVTRLAKIEGRDRGYSEMVLLNQHHRVAEGAGSCVMMVRDGTVITPPPWEGALESITVEIVEALCKSLGIGFQRRPIERSELPIADEFASAGTIGEITVAGSLEGRPMGESPIFRALASRYRDAATGVDPHPSIDLSINRVLTQAAAAG